nr:MAG TPA: hypothetical protein [Caudoviricetes sp.]
MYRFSPCAGRRYSGRSSRDCRSAPSAGRRRFHRWRRGQTGRCPHRYRSGRRCWRNSSRRGRRSGPRAAAGCGPRRRRSASGPWPRGAGGRRTGHRYTW